ncbi:MAG TPA: chemotaxis response regulator protein-glutamate methylesterase [Verrucomicrobiae bacterium]|nr:chemotaxis response regulator protein-glutamate methylesterase [Verrucomicrobiae bacterium]
MTGLPKKRVLIVDDAVVVRKSLADAIARDPDLEVAATASNGRLALAKFPSAKPDIVLLDLEMPEMDGLETVRELRKIDARVPIIMFSTLTERGASITLEALSAGATDYVTKPSNSDGGSTSQAVSSELIPKIRALCRLPEPGEGFSSAAPPPSRPLPVPSPRTRPAAPVHIVAIGVSTGGPDALAHVVPSLPAELPVPIVIAQHMPPIFTGLLAARLSAKGNLPVRECVPGEPVQPGCAFLAPGDFHMVLEKEGGRTCLRTNRKEKENFCRPSVDVLFRSVARVYGPRALAVVLTGMGQDGLKGCEALHQAGARICVQDEASSVVWGMPGYVARAGLADKILPLGQIAAEIVRVTRQAAAGSDH